MIYFGERLIDEYSKSTKAIRLLKELDTTAMDQQLNECHQVICPDLILKDFVIEYKNTTGGDSLLKLNTRQLLKGDQQRQNKFYYFERS